MLYLKARGGAQYAPLWPFRSLQALRGRQENRSTTYESKHKSLAQQLKSG